MRTPKKPLLLVVLLILAGCVEGCKTPSLTIGWDSTNGWEIGPWQQYPDGRPPKVEPVPEPEPESEPDLEALDDASEPPITPQPSTGLRIRSGPIGLAAGEPTPIGPPGPGRLMMIPLSWQHWHLLDGTTEYRLYFSRQEDTNRWDGFETIPAEAFQAAGRRYDFRFRQGGTIRFVSTALRPPDLESWETNMVESDQSNMITVRARGFPEAPTELAPKR